MGMVAMSAFFPLALGVAVLTFVIIAHLNGWARHCDYCRSSTWLCVVSGVLSLGLGAAILIFP